jgi:predicted RNA-binding protein YlxR (DUF448 family)
LPLNKIMPERTCIACGKVRPQREMLRLVCTADKTVDVDDKGKKPGRGAYLCREPECLQTGLKGNKLERALRTELSSDSRENLSRLLKESYIG